MSVMFSPFNDKISKMLKFTKNMVRSYLKLVHSLLSSGLKRA